MYDYEKFTASALKNKYEIAFEGDRFRMTYGELSKKVSALYNALFNMGAVGSALLLSDSPLQLSIAALALSKCGINRIFGDSKVPCCTLSELLRKYSPELVFVQAQELERISSVLLEKGVQTVIVWGKAESVFPKQFELEKLIEKNDFIMIKDYTPGGEDIFTEDVTATEFDISQIPLRDGIAVDIPAFCRAGMQIAHSFLLDGRKLCVHGDKSAKGCKKHKVSAVITDRAAQYMGYKFSVIETKLSARRSANSFVDTGRMSERLSSLTSARVKVTFNGAVFAVTVIFSAKEIITETEMQKRISLLKSAAIDLLYPFDNKKTFAVMKEKKTY